VDDNGRRERITISCGLPFLFLHSPIGIGARSRRRPSHITRHADHAPGDSVRSCVQQQGEWRASRSQPVASKPSAKADARSPRVYHTVYPVLVHRPVLSRWASSPPRLTTTQLPFRFPSASPSTWRGDLHPTRYVPCPAHTMRLWVRRVSDDTHQFLLRPSDSTPVSRPYRSSQISPRKRQCY